MTNRLVRIFRHKRSASLGGELSRLAKITAPVVLLLLLCSSCSAITHLDEFEAIEEEQCAEEALDYSGNLICYEDIASEVKVCMDQEFNLNLSKECAYCRCFNCDVEIKACGLRCWEIVTCAILNRCDRGNISNCVAEKCAPILDRSQVGIEQASSLAVCVSSCNDVCLAQ